MKWAHKIQQDIFMFKEPEVSKKHIGENWLEINSNFVLIHLIMVARI